MKLNFINIENAKSDAIDSDNSFLDIKQIFAKAFEMIVWIYHFLKGK